MTAIQKFYENSNILITGSTGFVGKLLVEKLLRSCQKINQIFIIMRSKNGLSVQQRMDKYFKDQVFFRLQVENPGYRSKVIVIQGDIDCKDLNLSIEDQELLTKTVDIIFHAAASISFNQKLRNAINTNLHGIRQVINLANRMPNLKSFVHISTVYSNCHLEKIDEKIYQTKVSYKEVIHLIHTNDDEEIEKITPSLINESPNTYTFTKALAENFIFENCEDIPIGIFRPAIVVSTAKEPITGWIDNFYGPTGLIASAACGLLHIMHGREEVFSNIVPADMVVNAIIASGWEIGLKCKKLPIYNFVSTQNPLSWGEYTELSKLGLNYPFSNSFWYMALTFIRYKWLYDFLKFFAHVIPAYFIDLLLHILRKKPFMVKSYKKLHTFVGVLSYFTNKDWEYENQNVVSLWDKMSDGDKTIFNFDMSTINWNIYFKHYLKGIREHLYKDDLSNIEAARRKYRRLFWAHQILKYSFLFFVFYQFFIRIR